MLPFSRSMHTSQCDGQRDKLRLIQAQRLQMNKEIITRLGRKQGSLS